MAQCLSTECTCDVKNRFCYLDKSAARSVASALNTHVCNVVQKGVSSGPTGNIVIFQHRQQHFVSGCRCFTSVPHFLPATVPKPLAHVKHKSDLPLSRTSRHTSGEPTCPPFCCTYNTLPLNREPATDSLPLLGDTCSMNTSSCRGIRRPVIRMVLHGFGFIVASR